MKTLKMILAMIATLAVCIGIFSGCQASNPTPQSGDAPTATTVATTTTETTTTTQATTTTTEPAVVYTVNEDRLAEIGKTFAEIKEQYGGSPNGRYYSGGKIYYFEKSNYYHYFGIQDNWDILPANDAICQTLFRLKAGQLFNNLTETVSAPKLAEMYGLEHRSTEDHGQHTNYKHQRYTCEFLYNNYKIMVTTEEDFLINPDTNIEYVEVVGE